MGVIVILACPRAARVIDGIWVDLISGIDHRLLVTAVSVYEPQQASPDYRREARVLNEDNHSSVGGWSKCPGVCIRIRARLLSLQSLRSAGSMRKLDQFWRGGRPHMCLRRHQPLAPWCQRSCYLVVMSVKVIHRNYCVKKYVENTEIWNKIWVRCEVRAGFPFSFSFFLRSSVQNVALLLGSIKAYVHCCGTSPLQVTRGNKRWVSPAQSIHTPLAWQNLELQTSLHPEYYPDWSQMWCS